MAAPKVQSLSNIIAELQPGYAGQQKLYNQQINTVGTQNTAQKAALGAEKVQGFNQINNQATGRGLSFSGIPLDEQATYLSTKYLPGLQAADEQANTQRMSLQQALASLNTDIRNRALDTRKSQQSSLEAYLENERQRQFTAKQNALDRAAQAAKASQSAAADYISPEQYASQYYAQGYDQTRGKTAKGAAEALIGELVARGQTFQQAADTAYKVRKQLYKE